MLAVDVDMRPERRVMFTHGPTAGAAGHYIEYYRNNAEERESAEMPRRVDVNEDPLAELRK